MVCLQDEVAFNYTPVKLLLETWISSIHATVTCGIPVTLA